METTAGPRGGGNASIQLDKGAMRDSVWADIGLGADLVSYWQWRDALNGGEQNHGALVDVDGEPDPIYADWAQIGSEFERPDGASGHYGRVGRRDLVLLPQPLDDRLAENESEV